MAYTLRVEESKIRRMVCVSLYSDDLDLLTALILSARESNPRASRSSIIREAIKKYAEGSGAC